MRRINGVLAPLAAGTAGRPSVAGAAGRGACRLLITSTSTTGEQRLADRDRGALDERDDAVGVLADVALADLTHELVTALLDLINFR